MTDALERIKNRQRPAVPKRDPGLTSATSANIDVSVSRNLDIQISTPPDVHVSDRSTHPSTSDNLNLENEQVRHPDLQIPTLPEEASIPVKQTTLRLEKAVSEELQALCNRNQICREVLIEAMFLELLNAPELQERVVGRAIERQRKRTAAANHKRAVSMMQQVLGRSAPE
jgi:hypothetical protein